MAADPRARFFFNTNLLIVTTDLEPDDLLALWLLARHFKDEQKQPRIVFVCGEGLASIKCERMKVYAEKMGFANYEILMGFDSDEDFLSDGEDVLSQDVIARCRCEPASPVPIHELRECILAAPSVSILSLKPVRELMHMWDTTPNIFSKSILAGYMSFNLRTVMTDPLYNVEAVTNMLASFQEVIYYDTFHAVGSDNCISADKGVDFEHMPAVITNLVASWNAHILQNAKEKLERTTSHPSSKDRARKIIVNIESTNGMQMVNADCGLIWALIVGYRKDFKRGRMVFDQETLYPTLEEGEYNTYLFDPADKAVVRDAQIGYYNSRIAENVKQ